MHAFDKSAAELGVDQIDVLIFQQAMPSEFERTIEATGTRLTPGVVMALSISRSTPMHWTCDAGRSRE